jgi:SEC-C motif-containing protein
VRGRPLAFERCCGRYLGGHEAAPDAPSLMRSRYSAFVRGDEPYLLATWHPSTRPAQVQFEAGAKWLGMELRDHRAVDAVHAEVEFVARYKVAGHAASTGSGRATSTGSGQAVRLHERSHFLREGGRWFYVDGDLR